MTGLVQAIQRLPSKTRVVALTVFYGLSAGLAAVAFEVGINLFFGATFVALSKLSTPVFLAGTFTTIVLTSLISGLLLTRFCPEAAGSGIPQVKLSFWKDFGYIPFRVVWVKFIAGLLTVGGGASLGREGPTVQLAGGLTSHLSGYLGVAKTGRRQAAAAGYDDLDRALNDGLGWRIAALLLVAKFATTVVGYGSGGCGGIFAPNLFLGAMCGALLSGLSRQFGIALTRNDHILLAVVAMSACLGSVVRAPLTSILIVFEMTHEFILVPGLLVGGLISQAVSRALVAHNFYEQVLIDDGHSLKKVMPPRDLRSWREYPVSAVANFSARSVKNQDYEDLAEAFGTVSFERIPIVDEAERPLGVVTRSESIPALAKGEWPARHAAPTCHRDQLIRDAQRLLIDSEMGIILVVNEVDEKLLGLLTLHDLLRAQEEAASLGDA